MPTPVLDPQIPLFKVRMDPSVPDRIRETIASGMIAEGPQVVRFEEKLSQHFGGPILTVNSCTSALQLAATMLDLEPGDEVVSSPITCAATNLALLHAGANIVWADVDKFTGRIDPNDVARKVTERTRAVVAVDWGGALCDFAKLRDAASGDRRYGSSYVIEDAAHTFGAREIHSADNSGPDFACWSFQAIKHLTTGDGGALYALSADDYDRARLLRWFGIDRRAPGPSIDKPIEEAGHKWHMSDLDATIGLANFEIAKQSVELCRLNAAWLGQQLAGDLPGIRLPDPDPTSSWWFYTVILEENDQQAKFQAFMAQRGIETSRVHSRNDMHDVFSGMSERGFPRENLPGVDYFETHQMALPCGWWIGPNERARIAQALRDWSKR